MPPNESLLKDADALVFNELGIALVGVEEDKVVQMKLWEVVLWLYQRKWYIFRMKYLQLTISITGQPGE
jgi:hypothetical protein